MKKTKDSLGLQFQKAFCNNREKDPYVLRIDIVNWLESRGINTATRVVRKSDKGIIADFFRHPIILEVIPNKAKKDIILIGKGVTFDTGGYNVKADASKMHHDKDGAILAIAAGIDNNIHTKVFLGQNIIDAEAVVPGEILTEKYTGIRVVVDNTDAEGRLGLCELIAETKSKHIITIATLTGAAAYTTGKNTMAMIHSTTPKKDYPELLRLALADKAKWLLSPFHAEYDKAVRTKVIGGDLTNSPGYYGAGSSTAFSFLKAFTKSHLIHLDIAGLVYDPDGNGVIYGLDEVSLLIKFLGKNEK